jgi:hypothetical protein
LTPVADSSMCIEHIISLVRHRVEEASEDQSQGLV